MCAPTHNRGYFYRGDTYYMVAVRSRHKSQVRVYVYVCASAKGRRDVFRELTARRIATAVGAVPSGTVASAYLASRR